MKDLRNSDGDQWSPNCTTFSDPPHPDRLLGRGNTTPTRKHPATPRARSTISIRYCHDHTRGWLIDHLLGVPWRSIAVLFVFYHAWNMSSRDLQGHVCTPYIWLLPTDRQAGRVHRLNKSDTSGLVDRVHRIKIVNIECIVMIHEGWRSMQITRLDFWVVHITLYWHAVLCNNPYILRATSNTWTVCIAIESFNRSR